MSAATVYERQFPELQAHLRDAITRYGAAEARVAELEAGIRAIRSEVQAAGLRGLDDQLRLLLGSEAAS